MKLIAFLGTTPYDEVETPQGASLIQSLATAGTVGYTQGCNAGDNLRCARVARRRFRGSSAGVLYTQLATLWSRLRLCAKMKHISFNTNPSKVTA
jgi:hypothetical protein